MALCDADQERGKIGERRKRSLPFKKHYKIFTVFSRKRRREMQGMERGQSDRNKHQGEREMRAFI
jgi:hypothetical protein